MSGTATRGRVISGEVAGVYAAQGASFVTVKQDVLTLTYEGIPGDVHAGPTRRSGAREPWYKHGTEMCNERQVSILGAGDLAEVAEALGVDRLSPEWLGANLLLTGVPHVSLLPPRTLLMFPSGATIRIDGDNGPCRQSGRSVAANFPERKDLEFAFVKAAMHRRGVVGWVEREGKIRTGDAVKIRIWAQRPYPD